jgi:glutathione synthase
VALRDVDAVVMRKDPPFDSEYFYATHLLGQAEREGAQVFNKPSALRDHPEKLAILEFPQFIARPWSRATRPMFGSSTPSMATSSSSRSMAWGGMGIFRVGQDGLNLGSIVETLNRDGAQTLMVQKFLPQIVQGDKRILVIAGEPVPFALARIPTGHGSPRQPGCRRQRAWPSR